MKKRAMSIVSAALIISLLATPISSIAEIQDDLGSTFESKENIATESNAKEETEIPETGKAPETSELQEKSEFNSESDELIDEPQKIEISEINLDVKSDIPLREENIKVSLETENCSVSRFHVSHYNEIYLTIIPDSGYKFSIDNK